MLAEHKGIAEIAKELGVSENTYHRWRNQYGGMKAYDVKRLRELERENQRLKRIVLSRDHDGGREPRQVSRVQRTHVTVAMARDIGHPLRGGPAHIDSFRP